MSRLKTGMLLATLTALILWIGHSMGGREGIVIALIVAGAMNFVSYWWSDKIALRMHHAQEVKEGDAPKLYQIVQNLAQKAGIPMPRVYVSPTESPNAFATGRNPSHAAVCVTAGLLNVLDSDEIEGVIAHELGHVQHRDTLIMTLTATLAGALSMLTRKPLLGLVVRVFSVSEINRLPNDALRWVGHAEVSGKRHAVGLTAVSDATVPSRT